VTKNNETVLYEAGHRNGYNLNPLTSIYERASLVPAAAVIPALKMHRIIAAVKKLVVGSVLGTGSAFGCALGFPAFCWFSRCGLYRLQRVAGEFTLKKSKCLIQAICLNVVHGIIEKDFGSLLLVLRAEIMVNRDKRGHSYRCVRGEILGPQRDELQRKHLPRMSSLIKNESQRFEGDQIPP
jgi:hypothetical protein